MTYEMGLNPLNANKKVSDIIDKCDKGTKGEYNQDEVQAILNSALNPGGLWKVTSEVGSVEDIMKLADTNQDGVLTNDELDELLRENTGLDFDTLLKCTPLQLCRWAEHGEIPEFDDTPEPAQEEKGSSAAPLARKEEVEYTAQPQESKGFFGSIISAAQAMYNGAKDWTVQAYNDAKDWTEQACEDVKDFATGAYDAVAGFAASTYKFVCGIF